MNDKNFDVQNFVDTFSKDSIESLFFVNKDEKEDKDIYIIDRNGISTTIRIDSDVDSKFSILHEKIIKKDLYSDLVVGNKTEILKKTDEVLSLLAERNNKVKVKRVKRVKKPKTFGKNKK